MATRPSPGWKLEAPVLNYQAHLLMGNLYSAAGNLDQAYSSNQLARQALETLRSSLRGEELKIAFIKNRLEVYERLVELCIIRPGALEEAFTYIEQAKSRSLMDFFLRPATTVEDDSGQSELVRSMRDLREELNWYYNLIEREQLQPEQPSPERIASLQPHAGPARRNCCTCCRKRPRPTPNKPVCRLQPTCRSTRPDLPSLPTPCCRIFPSPRPHPGVLARAQNP